VEPTPE
jgi:geranylgeranyl transferase type-2 subunit alpha